MSRRKRTIWITALAALVAAAGASAVMARTFTSAGALRQALPVPGSPAVSGTSHFVGTSGNVNVAVVRSGRVALAYICDGARLSRWLTGRVNGNRVTLAGKSSTLRATVRGNRIAGTAKVGGRTISFTLQKAKRNAGLRRITGTLAGRALEAAWVVANNRRILGTATSGGVTAFSTTVNTNEPSTSTSGEVKLSPIGQSPDPEVIRRARCAVLMLRIGSLNSGQLNDGTQISDSATEKELRQRFDDLNCRDFFVFN